LLSDVGVSFALIGRGHALVNLNPTAGDGRVGRDLLDPDRGPRVYAGRRSRPVECVDDRIAVAVNDKIKIEPPS
jgi:hypothetical protein